LDNCEHLVRAAADVVGNLLAACRDLRILATSREPLDLMDELVWGVPSLPLPSAADSRSLVALGADAVRLFAERAAAAAPGFEASGTNIEVIAHICRRLDGIPLAIELAAARLNVLSLVQLA